MKRLKKKRPLFRKKRKTVPVVAGFPGVIAGYPEFWQKAHDRHAAFFWAAYEFVPVVNSILAKPVTGQLAIVERFLAAIVANSFGALITLTLNGYGHDAMRIARGMYEAAVNAIYLKLHPDEIDDYVDYHWVSQKKLYDYVQRYDPDLLGRIPSETIAEMHEQLKKVEGRYQDSRERLRNSWCRKDLRARADEVGLGKLYPTFYRYASGIHHGDISGLISQAARDSLDAELAPSFAAIKDALIMGHNAVLQTMHALNETAKLGMDEELTEARRAFMEVWGDKTGEKGTR